MTAELAPDVQTPPFDPTRITRPDKVLMRYYLVTALLTGPLFPLAILPLWFRYETLRYRFDEDGLSMSWGVLFRREIHLTYRRIQDIHLTRNVIQRWLGLATVGIQTASGSARPEMSIEGILAAEPLRDYLYSQMRGTRQEVSEGPVSLESPPDFEIVDSPDEVLTVLHEIRDLLRQRASERGFRS